MVDGATDQLLQVELNTISTSSNGLACGVCELHRSDNISEFSFSQFSHAYTHSLCFDISTESVDEKNNMHAMCRNLIRHHERELGLDAASVVGNTAITQHAEALATAWAQYNRQRFV